MIRRGSLRLLFPQCPLKGDDPIAWEHVLEWGYRKWSASKDSPLVELDAMLTIADKYNIRRLRNEITGALVEKFPGGFKLSLEGYKMAVRHSIPEVTKLLETWATHLGHEAFMRFVNDVALTDLESANRLLKARLHALWETSKAP